MSVTVALAVAISEKEWQRQVVALAKQLGWRTYHTLDSRRSAHGFPDLVLVRDRVVFLELKTEAKTSRLSEAQRDWLAALRDAHAEAYVARPARPGGARERAALSADTGPGGRARCSNRTRTERRAAMSEESDAFDEELAAMKNVELIELETYEGVPALAALLPRREPGESVEARLTAFRDAKDVEWERERLTGRRSVALAALFADCAASQASQRERATLSSQTTNERRA